MKSMQSRGLGLVGVAVLAGLLGTGCATNIRKPAMAPAPTEVKLSTFKQYILKPVAIAPAFSASSANQKACRKIETELFAQLSMALPGLEKAEADGAAAPKGKRVLVIEPVIEEIKFIGGFARFMVGGMAGSSAVLMKVTFLNSETGKVVAEPEFYRAANGMGGGYSIGATDNLMLDQIAQDIALYAKMNL